MPIQGIAKTLRQLADQLDEIAAGESGQPYTLKEVRAALAELSMQKGSQHVKDLIASFDAEKLSDVFPADYPALMRRANGRD